MVGHSNPVAENVLQPEVFLISRIKTLSDQINESVLQEKYLKKGLSSKQIARELKYSHSTILTNLKRFNIPLREPGKHHGRQVHPPYGKKLLNGTVVDHKG